MLTPPMNLVLGMVEANILRDKEHQHTRIIPHLLDEAMTLLFTYLAMRDGEIDLKALYKHE